MFNSKMRLIQRQCAGGHQRPVVGHVPTLHTRCAQRSAVAELGWHMRASQLTKTVHLSHDDSKVGGVLVSAADNDAFECSSPCKKYCVVNFYHLVDISDPQDMIERHREYMKDKDVRGRIYISEQGVNAQYGGETTDAVGYAKWLIEHEPKFDTLVYSVDLVEEHMFPKLRLQYKPNLISLAGGMCTIPVTDPTARATKVKPSDWKSMLANGINGKRPIVLDVRNSYEWDAGHFEGAERPLEDNFHETPTESTNDHVPKYLENIEPDTPVMMYCTGGIRCDVYSTYLKQKGYDNLYTLEGGIQNYMKSEGLQHWKGSLYVFDGRMAIRPNKDRAEPLEPVADCTLCGDKAILPHLNCANVDCNKLFLACQRCQDSFKGCCCESCMDAPRMLRPIKPEGAYGQYAKMSSYTPLNS
jgi:predicted sulfurtransferase